MLWQIILAAGVPSAIFSFVIWLIQRGINKRDQEQARIRDEEREKQERREKNIEQLMLIIMNTSRSTNVLAEATARAVQRIPDAKCNGDMTAALELAEKYQKEEKDFILNQGIQHIFND